MRQRSNEPNHAGSAGAANAAGIDASFVCGCYTRMELRIDPETKEIAAAAFGTNGCGFMTAAADVLAAQLLNRKLTDLHGGGPEELSRAVEAELGAFPAVRRHCLDIAVSAINLAFADFRARSLEEFQGEKALICTCFGVSEETVRECIEKSGAASVEDVTGMCRAGGGCGSCRMLIQELIDVHSGDEA